MMFFVDFIDYSPTADPKSIARAPLERFDVMVPGEGVERQLLDI